MEPTEGREMFKTHKERDAAIRSYAAGETSWASLQRGGIDSFVDVLQRLGELGLRQPVAPLDGPTAELRKRARAIIAERIRGG